MGGTIASAVVVGLLLVAGGRGGMAAAWPRPRLDSGPVALVGLRSWRPAVSSWVASERYAPPTAPSSSPMDRRFFFCFIGRIGNGALDGALERERAGRGLPSRRLVVGVIAFFHSRPSHHVLRIDRRFPQGNEWQLIPVRGEARAISTGRRPPAHFFRESRPPPPSDISTGVDLSSRTNSDPLSSNSEWVPKERCFKRGRWHDLHPDGRQPRVSR